MVNYVWKYPYIAKQAGVIICGFSIISMAHQCQSTRTSYTLKKRTWSTNRNYTLRAFCLGEKCKKLQKWAVKWKKSFSYVTVNPKEKPLQLVDYQLITRVCEVLPQGVEPWTPWLRVRCSTNWATEASFATAKVQPFFILTTVFSVFFNSIL